MGEQVLAAPVAELAARGEILPADVLKLRREVFHDGLATREEAEALFALDAACADKCSEWFAFFSEAVSDYVVFSEPPAGHVAPDNAAWLRRMIAHDGRVDTVSELDILIVVLEKARSVPSDLAAFALQQVADAVVDGIGPLAGDSARGVVSESDLKRLRRILYAAGGEESIAVSRDEADVLFAINENVVPGGNAAFDDLFVKAIGSFLLGATGHVLPSRADALGDEAFLSDIEPNLGRFFSRMLSGGLSAIVQASRDDHSVESHFRALNQRRAENAARGAEIDQSEVEWLARRIGRTGMLNRNERALMTFLSENASVVHPDLEPILRRAG